jgi:hypothetical protein
MGGLSRLGMVASIAVGVLGTSFIASPAAMAQDGDNTQERLRPPTPAREEKAPTISMMLLSAVLIAAVVGASVIPSKRGHQD